MKSVKRNITKTTAIVPTIARSNIRYPFPPIEPHGLAPDPRLTFKNNLLESMVYAKRQTL